MNNKKNNIKMIYRVSESLYNDIKEFQYKTNKKISPMIRIFLKDLVSKDIEIKGIEG